jgi:serine/threonine-protein kinase
MDRVIGKYRIDGVLGTGSMGVVYRGFDPSIKRAVALKTIRSDLLTEDDSESLLARFQNEAVAAGRLTHSGIVMVFDFGVHEDTAFIVMELVEGVSLRSMIAKNQVSDIQLAGNLVMQVLRALDYAHGCGIIHRDIKPANLIVTESNRVKITDFGVAKIDTSQMTVTGSIVGTPSYMSPEQFRGESTDGRADIFSTAVILYELLTGARPFKGNQTAVMHGIINEVPTPPSTLNPDLPKAFDAVVLKGLEKRPQDRHARAADFRRALQEVLASTGACMAELSDETTLRPPAHGAGAPDIVDHGMASLVLASTAGVDGSRGSIGTDTTFSHWSPDFLLSLEGLLTQHVGPIARTLVRRAAKDTTTLGTLSGRLLESIGSETGRQTFSAGLAGLVAKFGGQQGTRPGAVIGSAASHSGNTPGTAAGHLPPDLLANAERLLMFHVGPIARVLVRNTAKKSVDAEQFRYLLAEHIGDSVKRQRFLQELGAL